MLTVTTNIASISAQNTLSHSQRAIDKSFAQISSGSRITKAADDAAGLAISEGLKSSIRGFTQAQRNANNGISMLQVAEGGLSEINYILSRLRELAVQAASDNISDFERGLLNKEVQQLTSEIQRNAESTTFEQTRLLDGSGEILSFQVGLGNDNFRDRISFDAGEQVATTQALGVDGLDFSEREGAREALEIVEGAQTKVNGYRANLGAVQSRLLSASDSAGVRVENLSAANSRIRDTDVAKSSAELARNQILLSASLGVLSQANQAPSTALRLIG